MICTDESHATDSPADEPHEQPCQFPPQRAEELLRVVEAAVQGLLGRPDDELVSDTIQSAMCSWHRYDDQWALSTWVGRIAKRRHQDIMRREGRLKRREQVFRETFRETVDSCRKSPGRPGLSDAQKMALLRLAVKENLSAAGVSRLLNAERTVVKALGLNWVPQFSTIARAIAWAREN